MVTVVAIRAFDFKGRFVHAGEAVCMEAVEAAALGFAGHVSLDPQMRATYQTRDMSAQPVAVVPVVAIPASMPSRPAPRRRGRGRRSKAATVSA